MVKKKQPIRKRIESPFSKNLKAILEERGISQRAAAEIAGVNPASINEWLNGSHPSDPMATLKLCQGLKCDYQWLMTDSRPNLEVNELGLSEIFEIQDEADFSGIYMIEAKKLKRRK